MKTLTRNNATTKRSNKFIIKRVPICAGTDYDENENIEKELLEIIAGITFNRITIPLNAYRYSIMPDQKDNTKSITIGYIRTYNSDDCTFDLVIFDQFKDVVKRFSNYSAEVKFGIYNDHVTKINQISLIDLDDERYDTNEEEMTDEVSEE